MIRIDGVNHLTLADAAKRFGVSPKTANGYIIRGILLEPPRVKQGLRSFYVFSQKYLREAEKALEVYRKRN